MPETSIQATVVAKEFLPNQCMQFRLQLHTPINYLPGQFITLLHPDGKTRRAFSISSPLHPTQIHLTVKRIENGIVSRWLHDEVITGDTIQLLHPNGKFVFVPQHNYARDIVLIGAGSGISPFMSILPVALEQEPQSRITLIYSNHSKDDTLYFNELQQLQTHYATQLVVEHMWSNNKNLMQARLNPTVLSQLLGLHLKYNKHLSIFYLCGPADYMLMVRLTLLGLGFSTSQIVRETFYMPPPQADEDATDESTPVQTKPVEVQLNLQNTIHRIVVEPGYTMLDAALKQGIDLPYSCKSGMCSTCIAQCNHGTVHMHYNEVLTAQEVAQGRILLCQSIPISKDVKVTVA